MNNKKVWILLVVLFFLAGAAGSYLLTSHVGRLRDSSVQESGPVGRPDAQDLITVNLYLPKDHKLEPAVRKIQRRMKTLSIAEALVEEYFRAAGDIPSVPHDVKVLGIYRDASQIIYVNLSDEVRRNFQGDALDEYLLLKGIFDSLMSNLPDFQDVKILVEGKEIETLGGHLYLKFPLKSMVAVETRPDQRMSHE